MIYPEVINHMEADDLRNLVCEVLWNDGTA